MTMKNDIKYLMECQNLSEYQDTLTGLLNRKGFSHELHLLIHKNEEPEQVFCILLQTAINADHLTLNDKSREISVHQEISAALRDIMPKLIIAKLEQNTYAIAGIYTNESCDTNAHFLH